jgi:hypothetical protein
VQRYPEPTGLRGGAAGRGAVIPSRSALPQGATGSQTSRQRREREQPEAKPFRKEPIVAKGAIEEGRRCKDVVRRVLEHAMELESRSRCTTPSGDLAPVS